MKYTFEKIVKTLATYRDNDNALTKTSEEVGISYQTIRNWDINFGGIIYGLIDNAKGNLEEVYEEDFNRIRSGGKVEPKPKTELTEPKRIMATVSETEMLDATYEHLITDTKMEAVRKLRRRIIDGTPKSISARDLTDALKLLHEIDKGGNTGELTKADITEEYAQLLILSHKKTVKQVN